MRIGRALAVLAAVSLAAGAMGACGGQDEAAPRGAVVSGLTATLEDELQQAGRRVNWKTDWNLRWRPVAGAQDYLVTYVTLEGTSGEPEVVREPRLRLSVARGVSGRGQGLVGRRAQLSLQASQLAVAVAARFPDGRVGPRSRPFPVGEPLPG